MQFLQIGDQKVKFLSYHAELTLKNLLKMSFLGRINDLTQCLNVDPFGTTGYITLSVFGMNFPVSRIKDEVNGERAIHSMR